MLICPHCEAEIDYVDFNQTIRANERGTETFPLGFHGRDYGDTETDEVLDTTYYCPECAEEISDTELHTMGAYDEDRNPRRGNRYDIAVDQQEGDEPIRLRGVQQHRRFNPEIEAQQEMVECTHCHHTYEDTPSAEMYCPRCEQTWTIETAQPEPPNILDGQIAAAIEEIAANQTTLDPFELATAIRTIRLEPHQPTPPTEI